MNFFLVFIFEALSFCDLYSSQKSLLIWDIGALEQMKSELPTNLEAKNIIKAANNYCEIDPVVIVGDKFLNFAPDDHYFCSIGPYWWPDPEHTGAYINRDGIRNPDYSKYDSGTLDELEQRCEKLSKAFYITKDEKYFDVFVRQLKAWFIDKNTYMYPNFEYSQIIPGKNNNKGRSAGSISAYAFNTIIESIRLVCLVKQIDRSTYLGIRRWFLAFANWESTHYERNFESVNNNISLAFDVTQVNMYLFAGRPRKAKKIANGFAERRIYKQIKEDGSQPEELRRTNAYGYSIYNLSHIIDFCYIARYWDDNYYEKHRERIDRGFDFLRKCIDHPELYPYQQISGLESCAKRFNNLVRRRDALRKND